MKPIWKSKTVWIAVIQGVGGIAIAVASQYDAVGIALILKSLVDIALRTITVDPIR